MTVEGMGANLGGRGAYSGEPKATFMQRLTRKLVIFAVLFALAGGFLLFLVRWVVVQGSERVVWQTISGVRDELGEDGLHFYFGPTTTPHVYDISSETFIVDDKTVNPKNKYMDADELEQNQPDVEPVEIPVMMDRLTQQDIADGKTTGPTNVKLSCVMQYHLSADREEGAGGRFFLVRLHNEKTSAYRTTFMKDVLLELIISKTTVKDARTVYQGAGRVALQDEIEDALKGSDRFKSYGVIVEKFVIREIEFMDKEFLSKIQDEARAEQVRKTAIKEEIAALAVAQAEKAKAKAEQEKRLVEANTKKGEEIARAEAEKQKVVLAAEAQKQQVVLAAEADKQQVTLTAQAQMEKDRLEGEGLKLRKLAEAEGVLALGNAEAEVKKMLLIAYQGEGGQRFAEVEKAKALGAGIEKIYYVPESMGLNAIARDFQGAIAIGLPSGESN